MSILHFIGYLFGATFNLFLGILKIIFILIIAGVAFIKGYNPWLWGLGTLILPWPFPIFLMLIITSMPKKLPKLPRQLQKHPAFAGKNPVIASIMALCAMIAKADGSVSKEEIHFIKDFVRNYFGVGHEELNSYSEAFDYGKSHPEEYLTFVDVIMGYYRTRRDQVLLLAYLFVGIALKEGESTEAKEQQTRNIIRAFGLTEYEYQAIKRSILGAAGGYGYEQYQGGGYAGGAYQSQEDLVKKYTEVLGVDENASWSEIKKAYRKLVKEYHPDKLAADSVPPDYIEFANQKIRDINEAYEYLEKVKGDK